MRSLRIVAGLLLCLLPYHVMAQSFPVKPMRIVVRAPPGGTEQMLQLAKQDGTQIDRIVRTAGIKGE